jgi:hypothetical protein
MNLQNYKDLSSDQYLQKGDYVYEHDREGYPLQKDIDVAKLYVITGANRHKLELLSLANKEIEIDLQSAEGY